MNKLSEAFGTIVAAPEFKAFCDAQYLDTSYEPAATVRAAAAGEAAKWRRLVELTHARTAAPRPIRERRIGISQDKSCFRRALS